MARPRQKNPFEVIAIHRPRRVRMTVNTQDGEDQKIMKEDDGQVVFGPETVFATSRRAAILAAYKQIVTKEGMGDFEPDDLDIRCRAFNDDGGCGGGAEDW